jgi:hypothetical protein
MFFFQEYNVAMKKKASNKNIAFTIGELVGYRLDYHFSSSKMAKPLLFFAITFVGERGDQSPTRPQRQNSRVAGEDPTTSPSGGWDP